MKSRVWYERDKGEKGEKGMLVVYAENNEKCELIEQCDNVQQVLKCMQRLLDISPWRVGSIEFRLKEGKYDEGSK